MKFNILPRNRKNKIILTNEYIYYKKLINNKFNFLKSNKVSSNEIMNMYKFVFASYSSMGMDALAKGIKCGFVFVKSKSNRHYGLKPGGLEKFKNDGPFWTISNKINKNKIKRVFNYVINTSNKNWKKYTQKYTDKLMKYDYNNKTFRSVLKKVNEL